MKAKLIYTKEALPFILEALGYPIHEGFTYDKGKKIMFDNIKGFQKDIGIITNPIDLYLHRSTDRT